MNADWGGVLVAGAQLLRSRNYQKIVFAGIVLLSLLLRVYIIVSTTYVWDEDREWIPLGRSISLSGESAQLPWRSVSHGALTAYIVRITSTFLGDNPLGYRFGFALAGVLAVWLWASSHGSG